MNKLLFLTCILILVACGQPSDKRSWYAPADTIPVQFVEADTTEHDCAYCQAHPANAPPSVDTQMEILAYLAFRGVPDERLEEILKVKTTKWDYPLYVARGLAAIELYNRKHPNDGYEDEESADNTAARQTFGWSSVSRQDNRHRVQGVETYCWADTLITFGNIVHSKDKARVELVDPDTDARTWGPFVGIALSDSNPRDNNLVRVFFYSEAQVEG